MARALITGGAGFIGSHLADALLAEGWDVTVVDDLSTGFRHNVAPACHFLQASIADPEVAALIENGGFDAILHHAAQVNVRRSVEDPVFDAHQNIVATLNLLEAARKGGVRRFLFASSGGTVYGEPALLPVAETAPLQPTSPYGCSKASIELYLRFYREAYGLDATALRYGNVYGPRQNPHGEAGVIAIFCEKMIAGEQPVIFGDGEQTRDYIHVADVVAANLAALNTPGLEAVNIGTEVQSTVNQIFEHMNGAFGHALAPRYAAPRTGELQHIALDTRHAQQALGWKARTALADGIRETVHWYKAHFIPGS